MKKYALLVFCLLLFTLTFAQEKVNRKGKKALQFDFDGLKLNDPISNFSGIGGKYWLRDNFALRAGLQFENILYETDYENSEQPDYNGSINKMKLIILFENHFQQLKTISPYIGGKLSLSFSQSEEIQKPSNEKIEIADFDFSLGILIGIEYWINKNISLSGYQEIYYLYGLLNKESDDNPYKYTRKNIKSATSNLILSIYF